MVELVGLILGWVGTVGGLFSSLYLHRRAKRAEVGSREVATADQMVDLVKKSFEEALTLKANENKRLLEKFEEITKNNDDNKRENEKLRRAVARLERAIRSVALCSHRDHCPIPLRLRGEEDSDREQADADGQRARCRDPA